ncbi:MAG: oligosaccharide flippase family protein [Planctomycetota bacterium]
MASGASPQPAEASARQLGFTAARGSVWLMLSQAPMLPLGAGLILFLTRALGPEDYGRYATVMAILMWADWGGSALLSRATNKRVAQAQDTVAAAAAMLRLALAIGLAGAVVLFSAAGPLGSLLGDPELAPLFRLAAIDLPLFITARTYLSIHSGANAYGKRAISEAVFWPIRLLGAVLLVWGGLGVPGAILATVAASACELAIAACLFPVNWLARGSTTYISRHWILNDLLPLFGSAMALRITEGYDLLCVRVFVEDDIAVGAYAVAMNVGVIFALAGGALFFPLMTLTAQLRRLGHDEQTRRVARTAMLGTLWLVPPTAAVMMASETLTLLIFGEPYALTGRLLAVLVWAGWARVAIALGGSILAGATDSRWAWWSAAAALPLTLILIPIFANSWGGWGAAVGSVIGLAPAVLVSAWLLNRLLLVRLTASQIGWIGATTALALVAGWLLPTSDGMAIGYVLAVSALSGFMAWRTGGLNEVFGLMGRQPATQKGFARATE